MIIDRIKSIKLNMFAFRRMDTILQKWIEQHRIPIPLRIQNSLWMEKKHLEFLWVYMMVMVNSVVSVLVFAKNMYIVFNYWFIYRLMSELAQEVT